MFEKITANRFFPFVFLSLVVVISTLALWLPFIIHTKEAFGIKIAESNMHMIEANYDGLLYIIPAKTWYDPAEMEKFALLKPAYFAAHLPGYPAVIRIFSFLGYTRAHILTTLGSTILLSWIFYYLLLKLKITRYPLIVSTVFLFLPRFFVVRSIGAPESIFMMCVLFSLFSFERKRYVWAGVFGALATTIKSPGILLTFGYFLAVLEEYIKTRKIDWKWMGIGVIPLGLLAVFTLYGIRMHDFLAYFHSGDNIHLVAPFSVFNFQKEWVGTGWLEEILFYFFLYGLTIVTLYKSKYRSLFYFSLIFFIATLFVQHRDISRYSLPLWPLACIAFADFFSSRRFLIVFIILLPGIYLYALNFIIYNVMPVLNWSLFK